jgi:aryl-alcohol dehydrogenase-like predicted oxidoreductase
LLGGNLLVNRMGFGAMRLTGEGIWGWPPDRENAKKVLRRAVELGVNLIETADALRRQLMGSERRSLKSVVYRSRKALDSIWAEKVPVNSASIRDE